jgi:tetratricopeptide (TPR) repeat protein
MMKRWSLLVGLLGIVLAVLGTGCGGNPNLAGGKLHFDQAGRLQDPTERAARFRRARDTFRKAAREMPQSGEARKWLGQTYAELGQPDSAVYWLTQAVKTDALMEKDVNLIRESYWSRMINAGQASAKAAMEAEKGENKPKADSLYHYSLTDYRKAVVYAPERAETHRDCGVAYVHLGLVDSALTAFARAQEYAPNDTKIHGFRIAVLRREGDRLRDEGQKKAEIPDTTGAVLAYKASQRYFQQALDLKPTDADLIFYLNWNLGVTSYELANMLPAERPQLLQAAIDYYQRVLTDDPTYLDVLYNLFIIQKDGKEPQKALEIAKRMVDLRPKDGIYWGLYGTAQRLAKNNDRVYGPSAIREALSKRGEKIEPAQAQVQATSAGAGSDIMRRFRENGVPDEIRAFKDLQGSEWENWFYWTRGTAYGFVGGSERYAESFAPAGTLSVNDAQIVDRNGAKFITGTVTNGGNYAYRYCRVEFILLVQVAEKGANGEQIQRDEQVGRVFSSVDKLDPKGKWNFEIPLSGEGATATRIEPPDPAYPANGY